jgi:hypothetical protein
MSARSVYLYLGTLVLMHLQTLSYCQASLVDTAFLAASKANIVSLYAASIQQQSRLYNGTDYVLYQSREEEHPFFGIDDWAFGSITYWGEVYENVPVMYDLSTDQVITEHNRGNPIKLIPEKVDGFVVGKHTFQRLTNNGTIKVAEGFYERLYDGTSKVYAKHQKVYREDITAREVIPRFEANIRYYILKNGILNQVKKKGSLLDTFEDHKQEVKTFMKKNRIRFNDNRAVAIVRVTEYYDTLID